MCGSWLGMSSFGSWRCSCPRWHPWRTWSLTGCSPSWSRPPGSLRQSHLWSRVCSPRFCGLVPARVLTCLKLLLVALGAPFCSVNVGPLVCPSRAVPRLPTARSPPTATPVRLPPGRQVKVAPLAPLWNADANGTSTAGVPDASPSFKTSLGSACSLAVMKPRPMTTSTTPTTM